MIGFVVNTKVARLVKSRRKEKTLITREFLAALEREIERVVVLAVEAADTDVIGRLLVDLPKKRVTDRLVCDQRIKERVREIRSKATVTRSFLADVNAYAGAVIVASMELIDGAYIRHLASGSATAKVVDRAKPTVERPAEESAVDEPSITPRPETPLGIPDHICVHYSVIIGDATITCKRLFFTAYDDSKIERVTTLGVQRGLESIGYGGPFQVAILSTEKKGKSHK
jgi:hypothetical protein